MPVSPPAEAAPRFDPIYLTDDDLMDLSTFTGMSRKACLARLRGYSMTEMTEAWERASPRTPEEILRFYGSTDLYIWELMQWHASSLRRPYWDALAALTRRWFPSAGYRRVYDFGCGVGTDGLFLAASGYNVTLVDVPGPTFEFARHRFTRRGVEARFVESRSVFPDPGGEYDVVVCFDVFEHLPDPVKAARILVSCLRADGIMVQQGGFAAVDNHPCHLSENVGRFSGLRWHIQLAGLGLRNAGVPLLYRKTLGLQRLAQQARFWAWRATRLWIIRTHE